MTSSFVSDPSGGNTMEEALNTIPSSAIAAIHLACCCLITGCASIENPMSVPTGARDSLVYAAGMERTRRLKETSRTIDVFVDCDNVVLNSPGHAMTPLEAQVLLAAQIDGVLRARLEKFPFFRVTAGESLMAKVRSRRLANDAEGGVVPHLEQRERADYTILARIDSVYTHGDGGVANAAALGGSGAVAIGIEEHSKETSAIGGMVAGLATAFEPNVVEIGMTFELYDNSKSKTVHTEHLDRTCKGMSKHNTGSAILQAARECVAEYGNILAREYGQESRVLATRGEGKYAWVSLGRKDGVAAGSHIMFYEFTDAGDVIESWDRIEQPIAYGVVVGVPDENTCWTRVEKHSSVSVRKYHYAKLVSVQKPSSFLGRMGIGD